MLALGPPSFKARLFFVYLYGGAQQCMLDRLSQSDYFVWHDSLSVSSIAEVRVGGVAEYLWALVVFSCALAL